jgi:hypothetical protein
MRVRVSLDFDILIESFISLCIIETVGAIFLEYKPWIVLLITQWSKSSTILALSLSLFDLQGLLSAEAALQWNFAFWFYFIVIFRVGVDVLYRRAIRTSGILPVKSFSQPRVL